MTDEAAMALASAINNLAEAVARRVNTGGPLVRPFDWNEIHWHYDVESGRMVQASTSGADK